MAWNQIRVLLGLLFLVALFWACATKPTPTGNVNATVDGQVFVTGPVEGAIVTAYAHDLATGEPGTPLATAEPSAANGTFHLDLGSYTGPLLLITREVGATYVEPASGVTVAWDGTTELRASSDLALGEAAQITISPWSELALTYATARLQGEKSATYAAAREAAIDAFRLHLEVDYLSVAPRDLTSGAAAWNEAVQLGVAYAALSKLVLRQAQESGISPAGLTALQLLASLRSDLLDPMALFDGTAMNEAVLNVGTCASDCPAADACTSICRLSAETLRQHLSESAAEFLGSSANASGITVTDAQDYLRRIAERTGVLWPGGGGAFDTTGPVITVADLQEAAILQGDVTAEIRVVDAVEMSDNADDILVRFQRAGTDITGFFTETRQSPNKLTRIVKLTMHTTDVPDGLIDLLVQAKDSAGNQAAPLSLSLFIDNSPLGAITGTVVVSGRVAGAQVRAYEFDGGMKGRTLGESVADDEGVYRIEILDTVQNSILLEATNPGAGDAAQYEEAASGDVVIFSAEDALASIVTGWANGAKRSDGVITPWTTAAAAFSAGLFRSDLYNGVPAQWVAAVEDAYGLIEGHFTADGNRVPLRAVQPADLTEPGVTTLNAQARYGLLNSALSQLARKHAADSDATSATMNTLTLTKLLAADLGQDGDGVKPLWDGKTMAGRLKHGRVDLDSYLTRVILATYAVLFLDNPRNMTTFTMLDVDKLLAAISGDANPRLYPEAEPPLPYDTVKPTVVFTANKPAEGLVTRGPVGLEATAMDNRALSTFGWLATPTVPSTAIMNVLLDTGGQLAGPWTLSGTLNTDALQEGPATIQARGEDESQNATIASRSIVVDRTPPTIAIATFQKPDGSTLPIGEWTGPTTLTVTGTVTDANLQGASYTINGAGGGPLTLGAGGAWTVNISMTGTGTYTLAVSAVDRAGNTGSNTAAWNCDASPPSIAVVPNQFKDDTGRTASVIGSGIGVPNFGADVTTVTLSGGTVAVFQMFQTRYNPQNSSLPVWTFNVSDNHFPDASIVMEAKLARVSGGSTITLKDWFTVAGGGAGYNRSVKVSDALHADVAKFSGRFALSLRARDGFGNVTPESSVQWDQIIRTPPLRQRIEASFPCSCTDPKCPSHYSLGAQSGSCPDYKAAGILSTQVRAAVGYIDNPNPVPIQFAMIGDVTATASHGMEWKNSQLSDPAGMVRRCEHTGLTESTPQGQCYAPHGGGEFGISDVLLPTGLWDGFEVPGATYLGQNGSNWPVYEIPANASATVWALSKPWSFLLPRSATDYSTYGTLTNVVGWQETRFYSCDEVRIINDEPYDCVSQAENGALLQWTRGSVSAGARVSLNNRVVNGASLTDGSTWMQRVGTNLENAVYYTSPWSTRAPGYN